MILTHARLFPVDAPPIGDGFLAVADGKIAALGRMEDCPEGERTDLGGLRLYPGFVDAHCHLGIFGDSLGFEGADGNEMTGPVTPHLRAMDGVNPFDRCFQEAREGGVTTVLTGPGSANAIGGQFAALKTAGVCVDEMAIAAPVAMKFALGENPKRVYKGRNETPITRMGTAALIRTALRRAQEYAAKCARHRADPERHPLPDYDARLEALVPVVEGRLAAHFHAHRADDIATALRIGREFQLKMVIVHGTEGHRIAGLIARSGVPVITGPTLSDRSKPELAHLTTENAARLAAAGVQVAICTDHPENPIQYLPLGASLAVRAGMDPEAALRAITLGAAEIGGIAHRVGSLTVGKDADLVAADGDPLAVDTRIRMVWVDGVLVKGT